MPSLGHQLNNQPNCGLFSSLHGFAVLLPTPAFSLSCQRHFFPDHALHQHVFTTHTPLVEYIYCAEGIQLNNQPNCGFFSSLRGFAVSSPTLAEVSLVPKALLP
jgi:hypothetical protein